MRVGVRDSYCNTLQRTATHCNALQRTATHCNTLQHTATQRDYMYSTAWYSVCIFVFPCIYTTSCEVCVGRQKIVCILLHNFFLYQIFFFSHPTHLRLVLCQHKLPVVMRRVERIVLLAHHACVAVCCGALQCVAACCSVLQRITVCSRVL